MFSPKATVLVLTFVLLFSALSLAQEAKKKDLPEKAQEEITLKVNGLSCPFCAYGLEKKLKSIEGVNKIDIRLNEGIVKLEVNPQAKIDSLVLKKKVDEAGFTLKRFQKNTKAP